ncbi:gluconate 2-dehydrogenase subunit 3 family protein [Pseudomonas mangiferae]|uniref:Gluconate 2-dehydrogenase subunit 3 family protein n=1 Tax=Pseudomonas mangiferae TaxID=2593654 RepID=A0A553GW21_9PSED|nr:gluconate 2-dehydrogenase subunit 3 family protein [Pseudomonas mangiferae]TRX73653.1 gluconate 2-dehydrogenase subunit 3 family protein [Pseudomonas mangiferae]
MSLPRYPGYDVLHKRNGPSWNEPTRRAVDARLALPREPRFFDARQWALLNALCARILPQPADRPPVPLAAMVDAKVFERQGDGYRDTRLPHLQDAWTRGLAALDAEAEARHQQPFVALSAGQQDALLTAMQQGMLHHPAWGGMPPALFFSERMVHDITGAYYQHPTAWNEIGFGGPAGPRGYVRLDSDRRDPWEAAEARPGREDEAREANRRVR